MELDYMKERGIDYAAGYQHGMLAMQETFDSLTAKLAQANAEIQRLQEILSQRG
jgi:hypothetical protein